MINKFTVLVVDDDPDKLQLLSVALRMEGYEVRTAANGHEGLAAVEEQPPDLIITDVMMPEMDGYEMAERIRANPQTRFIPIMIQTAAKGGAEDQRRGSEVGALGYITDPTDLDLLLARARTLLDFRNYLDTLEEDAFTDHLSGVANRRQFERRLAQEVTRTERYGHPFCLILLDIDHFKNVNDTYGHEAGDETIRQLARTLRAGTRNIDTVARIGGEEFAVILPETDFEGGCEVAERLRYALKSMLVAGVGTITASFGIAECPSCALAGRELFGVADAALYTAKRNGRDRVERAKLPQANHVPALDV